MNVNKVSAPFPLEQKAVPAPKRYAFEDGAWIPARDASGPARKLQQQLYTAIARHASYVEDEISFAERTIRFMSRAAGYVTMAGTLGLIGWLII